MVTKTELKEMYGNRQFVNNIVDMLLEKDGQIVRLVESNEIDVTDISRNVVQLTESEAMASVQSGVRNLCKDMMKIVGIETHKSKEMYEVPKKEIDRILGEINLAIQGLEERRSRLNREDETSLIDEAEIEGKLEVFKACGFAICKATIEKEWEEGIN